MFAGTHEFPNLDRAIIKMTAEDKSVTKDTLDVDVKLQAHKLTVQTEAKDAEELTAKGVKKDIKVPMVHNVNVEGRTGSDL